MRHTTLLAVSQRAARGFSLLELLVVIGIMALLAGMVIPTVSVALEAQRRDECREDLERFAQAITRRTEYLATDIEYQYQLWQAAPECDGSGSIPNNYLTISQTYFNDPGQADSLAFLLKSNSLGIPFISSHVDPFGNTISGTVDSPGGPFVDVIKDPWQNAYQLLLPEGLLFCGGSESSLLWSKAWIFSFGPNGATPILGVGTPTDADDIVIEVHPFPILAKETLRRIDVVNQALLAYRKDLGSSGLGTMYASRSSGDGSTVYRKLVEAGYLPEFILPSDGSTKVPLYKMDAWGFLLFSDAQKDSSSGPVLTVYSGNLLWPGTYGGIDNL